ncbi:BQ5605_C006g04011 [Microbotryum silenes-dioicae]|uniref:BQ5605_C006g04011 protein n=1 Tax=Microbotryum silenes-dioicae TaxID=796604 RepID=A0A2X0P853_9BASI|nr:BQ5605_C006g04011 [Microbotryum silenes-dioicae]
MTTTAAALAGPEEDVEATGAGVVMVEVEVEVDAAEDGDDEDEDDDGDRGNGLALLGSPLGPASVAPPLVTVGVSVIGLALAISYSDAFDREYRRTVLYFGMAHPTRTRNSHSHSGTGRQQPIGSLQPTASPLAIYIGKWVNAASKWCNYQLRGRVYPRSLTHLAR